MASSLKGAMAMHIFVLGLYMLSTNVACVRGWFFNWPWFSKPPPSLFPPPPFSHSQPPPSSSYTPTPASMISSFLDPHNEVRSGAGVPPVDWDSKLEDYAQDWANKRAAYGNCHLQHSNGPYGENIFWGGGKSWTPEDAVRDWASEKQYYNYYSNSCQAGEMCGHYTQIVWHDTARIGCARVVCSDGDVFITCNYDPPGNYIGERPF